MNGSCSKLTWTPAWYVPISHIRSLCRCTNTWVSVAVHFTKWPNCQLSVGLRYFCISSKKQTKQKPILTKDNCESLQLVLCVFPHCVLRSRPSWPKTSLCSILHPVHNSNLLISNHDSLQNDGRLTWSVCTLSVYHAKMFLLLVIHPFYLGQGPGGSGSYPRNTEREAGVHSEHSEQNTSPSQGIRHTYSHTHSY